MATVCEAGVTFLPFRVWAGQRGGPTTRTMSRSSFTYIILSIYECVCACSADSSKRLLARSPGQGGNKASCFALCFAPGGHTQQLGVKLMLRTLLVELCTFIFLVSPVYEFVTPTSYLSWVPENCHPLHSYDCS